MADGEESDGTDGLRLLQCAPEHPLGWATVALLGSVVVELTIILAAARGNSVTVLWDAASVYNVDTDAIALKVKQEFAAKEKAKKTVQSTTKVVESRAS